MPKKLTTWLMDDPIYVYITYEVTAISSVIYDGEIWYLDRVR